MHKSSLNNNVIDRNNIWKNYSDIFILALIFRLLSVFFSQGYGMHDDHFLVIEAAGSWAEGQDYNHWLPSSAGNNGPEGHSFTYVGLHFLFFSFLKIIGIVDPKFMMFFVRLIHALFSMFTVFYGIKITEKLADVKSARIVGVLLSILWIIPFLSVRQLFEFTPIPLIMMALWMSINDKAQTIRFLYAGLLLGLAVSFRYQIGIFALGMALVYLLQLKWKTLILFCSGTLLSFAFTQSAVDIFLWGYPFAEMAEYIRYNLNEGTQYLPNTNYFIYFYVLVGVLLLPLGLLIFTGFFVVKREYLILFIPILLFLLFHTWYPNRQERFILTVLPMFIIVGVLGLKQLKSTIFESKLWRISWIIFLIINIPLLIFTSTMSSKKSRIDAMYSLYDKKSTPKNIILEGSAKQSVSQMPRFYSKDWRGVTHIETTNTTNLEELTKSTDYHYILFFEPEQLNERIARYKKIYPTMFLYKKCDPSGLDKILKTINPRNANEYIEVWKTCR